MRRGRQAGWYSSALVLVPLAAALIVSLSDAVASRPVAGVPATDSPLQSWAFGGSQLVNQSTAAGGYVVSQSGAVAWSTVLTERSTGPWSFSLEVERGLVAHYAYSLCTPTCRGPTFALSASLNGSAWTVAFLNLTADASASTPAGTTGALGLVNASVRSAEHLAAYSATSTAPRAGASQQVLAGSDASYTVAFAPSWALFPTGLADGATWSAQSTALSTGTVTRTLSTSYGGLGIAPSQSTSTVALPANAVVSLQGSVGPSRAIAGAPVAPVALSEGAGPFGISDGLVPLDTYGDLFGTASAASVGGTAFEAFATALDLGGSGGTHLALPAEQLLFHPTIGSPPGGPAFPAAVAQGAYAPPTWTVSASPEPASTATAQFQDWGLEAGPAPSSPSVAPGGILAGGVPLWAFVAVAGLTGTIVALGARWREVGERDATAVAYPEGAAPRGDDAEAIPRPLEPSGPPRDPFDDLL